MRLKSLILLAIAFFCNLSASNVKIYSINNLFGISLRETSTICTDKDGFIWAATKTGIIRLTYDDYRLYKLPAKTLDYFTTRLIYHETGLVAYTHNGQIFRYNHINDKFDYITDLRKDNGYLTINNLLVDKHGIYWISTSAGLFKYSNGVLSNVNKGAYVDYIAWKTNTQFFGFGYDGFWLFDTESPNKMTTIISKPTYNSQITRTYYDKTSNELWIGTISTGLFIYNEKNKTLSNTKVNYIPKQPIRSMESNSDSTLMVGVDGQGIWELSKKTKKLIRVLKEDIDDSNSLPGNGVYDIFCDKNKRVWISTYSGGISFFDQSTPIIKQITHYVNNPNSLANNFINQIIEDRNGNIWFATNNGICKWEMKSDRWTTFYHNKKEDAQVFLTICEDNKGRIWAGTYSSGIYVIDGTSGREISHFAPNDKNQSVTSNFIMDIFKDSQNNMWIAELPGSVVSYNFNENKFRTYIGESVRTFIELNSTKLLIGCTSRLALFDKSTGKVNVLLQKYWINDAVVIGENVWACTRGEGLICYNLKSKKFEIFKTESGLPTNYINSVINIGNDLWLGTENGLCKFNIKNKHTLTYSSLFPIANVAFNQNSCYKLRNGNLIWGTNNGAVLFDPANIRNSETKGKIFFDELTISGRSIKDGLIMKQLNRPLDSLENIELNYNQNTINLKLLPIGTSASDSRFSWKMDGLDSEWKQPANHRIITYTNLPNGKLVLRIKMYDSSMAHVIAERSISIHIIPPFWKSWWFIFLLITLIAFAAYFSLRYYVNYLKSSHSEEKIRFFANTAHDMRTSLTLINAPIEELSKENNLSEVGKYYLNVASEQVKRLSTVVNQLMDFQKIDIGKEQMSIRMIDIAKLVSMQNVMFESIAKRKNIEITFSSNESSYFSAVDETMIEKVISNLISNAVKYSNKDSQIYINLHCSTDKWTFEVIDQGIGISNQAQKRLFKEFYRGENAINSKIIGSGIGLLLVKNYVEMHGGTVNYESSENAGSHFIIEIPYKAVDNEPLADYQEIKEPVPDITEIEIPDAVLNATDHKSKEVRILIVEDNDDLRNFMKVALGVEFEVVVAEDGKQAWEIISKTMPDLVVSDVMMPTMNGFELCELVKSTYETSHIPIILLTALSEKTEQLRGLGLGADDYLTKPFDMTLLIQQIKSVIRNRIIVREKALKFVNINESGPILINGNNDKFVKKALEVVSENIADVSFGKDEFASAMNVSSSLLYKKIKALTDQAPVDFIKTIRLNYALELLHTKKYSVTEISEMCGFASIGYFSTVFKKFYGKSPSEWA